jgi:hypothetical protein
LPLAVIHLNESIRYWLVGTLAGATVAQGGYGAGTWGALFIQLKYTKLASGTPTAGQFLDEGGASGCKHAILAQVNSNELGTAYAFKAYLNQINSSVWSTYTNDTTNWPSSAVVESDPLSKGPGEQRNDSDGHLSENTAANPGSVGYAAVSAAMRSGHGGFTGKAAASTFGTGGGSSTSHQILWAQIQNNGVTAEGATYEDPLVGGTKVANCVTSKLIPSDQEFPLSATGSWHGILATDPDIASDAASADYSLCVLTYDLIWRHYGASKLYGNTESAQDIANTVKDALAYITGQGQIDIQGEGYTRFPTGMASHVAVAVGDIEK